MIIKFHIYFEKMRKVETMKKDYLDYLQSSKWQEKRIERLKMDNFRCCRCGSPHDVQVHHLTYKNIGNENVYEDLITLCDSCHESIEKEAISGCEYTKPIKYGNNFGVAKTIPLPANCAIIYTDMRDLDARKQLQLKGGTIRLCRAYIAPSDFLNNAEWYEEYKQKLDFLKEELPSYEEFQWEDRKHWYIFVEMKRWVHEVILNVIIKGNIHVLQNGVKVLHIDEHAPFESYDSPVKKEAEAIHQLLNLLQENYKEAANVDV